MTLVIKYRERRWGTGEEEKKWREADEIQRGKGKTVIGIGS